VNHVGHGCERDDGPRQFASSSDGRPFFGPPVRTIGAIMSTVVGIIISMTVIGIVIVVIIGSVITIFVVVIVVGVAESVV
jgi:hypothetical protein